MAHAADLQAVFGRSKPAGHCPKSNTDPFTYYERDEDGVLMQGLARGARTEALRAFLASGRSFPIRLREDLGPEAKSQGDWDGDTFLAPFGSRHNRLTNIMEPLHWIRFAPGEVVRYGIDYASPLLFRCGQFLEEVPGEPAVQAQNLPPDMPQLAEMMARMELMMTDLKAKEASLATREKALAAKASRVKASRAKATRAKKTRGPARKTGS